MSEGPSDQALVPILNWLLGQQGLHHPFAVRWEEYWRLPPPTKPLSALIQSSLRMNPCELLFVHRDADAAPPSERRSEIWRAINSIGAAPPAVCVVPVRMTEAWLLFNDAAIRQAANNPSGRTALHLPPPRTVEQEPDPKAILHTALKRASDKSRRRLRKFNTHEAARQVAGLIVDYAPLRDVPAFRQLEEELGETLRANGWLTAT